MRVSGLLILLLAASTEVAAAQDTQIFVAPADERTAYGATAGSALGVWAGEILNEFGGHVERRLAWRTSIRGGVALTEWPRGGTAMRLSGTGLYRPGHGRGGFYSGIGFSLYRGHAADPAASSGEVFGLSGSEIEIRKHISVPIEFHYRLGGPGGLSLGLSVGLRRWR